MLSDWDIVYVAQNAEKIWHSIRWPEGVHCSCGCKEVTFLKDGRYKCKKCGQVFSDKSGTLLHGSKIKVSYWMVALYLMLSGKGISSYELSRKLQVTQKTAYYMLMRLRQVFNQDNLILYSDVVAHDECYIGGDYKNFCLRKRQELIRRFNLPRKPKTIKEKIGIGNAVNMRTKKACFGMTDGKRCVLIQVPTPISPEDIAETYRKHVTPNGLAVSDCSFLYKHWKKKTGRELHTNNHSKGQYIADNGTSSNMIESVFSWLERTNTFVQVHYSRAYTQLYLDEFVFRFNHRKWTIKDKMKLAIEKAIFAKYDKDLLDKLNKDEYKLYDQSKWFDPYKYFASPKRRKLTEYNENGVVYRIEDFI